MELIRKTFARRDYEGLDNNLKNELKEYRRKLAKELNDKRHSINESIKNRTFRLKKKNGVEYLGITPDNTEVKELRGKEIQDAIYKSLNKRNGLLKKQKEILESNNKKLKHLGKYALASVGAAGLAYGGKKAYDHYKNK